MAYFNYDFDIAALAVLTVGALCMLLRPGLTRVVSRRLVTLLTYGFLFNLVDLLGAWMLAHPEGIQFPLLYSMILADFLLVLFYPCVFFAYLMSVIKSRAGTCLWFYLPAVIQAVLLLVLNPRIPLYFAFEPASYHLGMASWLTYLNWFIYLMAMMGILIFHRKRLGRTKMGMTWLMAALGVLTAVLLRLFPSVLSMGFTTSLCTVGLILTYHFLDLSQNRMTGLPGKEGFCRETEVLLEENRTKHYQLVRFDVHHFKDLNERLGWEVGDRFLKKMADIMQQLAGEDGTCGYLGSDDFVMCVPAEQISKYPLQIELGSFLGKTQLKQEVSCLYGVYDIRVRGMAVELMCDRAEYALEAIRKNYLRHFAYFDTDMELRMLEERLLEHEMFDALREHQFQVYYQPVFSMKSGSMISAEALVRWQHPEKGLIAPGKFIPLFERNGFITQLDHEITNEVCRQIAVWKLRGLQTVPVSVNASALDFCNQDLCKQIMEIIRMHGITAADLKVEVTESSFTDNMEHLLGCLDRLREQGVKILMDDFGSGYSSFNTFQDMPVDILKLDMKFLHGNDNDDRGRIVLQCILNMAQQLQIPTIAEGAETREQIKFLKTLGFDAVQGYYFARPMPAAAFEKYLSRAE